MLPFYVGKGKENRMFKHLYETFQNTENRKKYAVVISLLNHGILPIISRYAKHLDEDSAYNIEAMLIKKWGRRDFEPNGLLTNICIDNRPPSPKGKAISEETRYKMSQSKIGEKNPMFGKNGIDCPAYGKPGRKGEENGFYRKKHSPESIAIMGSKSRAFHTGRKRTDETRAKMREAQLTKVVTEETKRKLRAANIGKKQSAETIEKRRQTHLGRPKVSKKWIWLITSPSGDVYIYPSIAQFCREHAHFKHAVRKAEKLGWIITKVPKPNL
jgi:hypothetical protein